MLRLGRPVAVVAIILFLGLAVLPFISYTLPAGQTVNASPNDAISLSGCVIVTGPCVGIGWNGTTSNPNPTITVRQGDAVSVTLRSGDGLQHQFLFDADKDGGGDIADCPTVDPCSAIFPPATLYSFVVSVVPGTYNYYCTFHVTQMHGSFVVLPSQALGGTTVPLDKLGLIMPYLVIASIILLAVSLTLVYLRLAKRNNQ
jgi:plastocyanin